MYVCRLFHRDRPFEQLEARLLSEGSITIGRDPSADWPLTDLDGAISRFHCVLSVEDGGLRLRDTSTNGTFLGGSARAPRDETVALAVNDSFQIGGLSILIDQPDETPSHTLALTALQIPLSTTPAVVPADWSDPSPDRRPHRDMSLVEAFCEGAKLDSSALSAEDPAELMRKIGAIYQQTILGLGALMAERARLKQQYAIDRTTIGAADNNPFKWTPTRRLAQDLLTASNGDFLSDAEAVRASFEDLSQHLAGVAEGANAVTALVSEALSPAAIAAEAEAQGFSLRGRAAVCWDSHNRRYEALVAPRPGQDSPAARAFGDAYRKIAVDPLP